MAKKNNWRKGDRSEYLAQVFLSSLSFSNPVYRQEDFGIDFVCALIEKENGNLYPNETFNLQCKSGIRRKLEYTIKENVKELDWLLNNQTPILFSHLNVDKNEMYFYSISQIMFFNIKRIVFNKNDKIVIKYSTEATKNNVPFQTGFEYTKIGNVYHFNIGNPFMTMKLSTLTEAETEKKKLMLKKVLKIERENILFNSLHLPLMRWFYKYETDKISTFNFGWSHFCTDEWEKDINNPENLVIHLGQLLITLASSYQLNKDDIVNGRKYLDHHNRLRKIIADLPFNEVEIEGLKYNYSTYLKILKYSDENGNPILDI